MKTKTKKQRRTQDLMELLRITYILLMPCAQDIEGFNTMDVSKIYDVIDRAESDGFIRKFKAGQTFQEQMRIALTHKGINEVCSHFSLPLKQQFCARSHSENLARLRLNEPVMRLAPPPLQIRGYSYSLCLSQGPGGRPQGGRAGRVHGTGGHRLAGEHPGQQRTLHMVVSDYRRRHGGVPERHRGASPYACQAGGRKTSPSRLSEDSIPPLAWIPFPHASTD